MIVPQLARMYFKISLCATGFFAFFNFSTSFIRDNNGEQRVIVQKHLDKFIFSVTINSIFYGLFWPKYFYKTIKDPHSTLIIKYYPNIYKEDKESNEKWITDINSKGLFKGFT